tara:strand:- start:363 stop:557 length:195 start_codon:yes stop_codon:yes gene_type:complete
MELNEALNKCCDKVRELSIELRHKEKTIMNLKRRIKGEIQLREKAESYYRELEGFLAKEGEDNG